MRSSEFQKRTFLMFASSVFFGLPGPSLRFLRFLESLGSEVSKISALIFGPPFAASTNEFSSFRPDESDRGSEATVPGADFFDCFDSSFRSYRRVRKSRACLVCGYFLRRSLRVS